MAPVTQNKGFNSRLLANTIICLIFYSPTFAKTAPFAELRPPRTTTKLRLSKLFLPLLSLLDRRQRMHPTTALIVDCGSGFTRATVFSRDAHGHVRACEAHEHAGLDEAWRERRVVDALVEGGAALRDWAASIQALIDATGCTRAVVGTTGGLRQAVADGLVTPAMVAALVALLGELAPSATVRILSGEDEARAELAAVQYVADATLPAEAARPVGMLSGGGMSCQVGWHERGCKGPSFLSVTAALLLTLSPTPTLILALTLTLLHP